MFSLAYNVFGGSNAILLRQALCVGDNFWFCLMYILLNIYYCMVLWQFTIYLFIFSFFCSDAEIGCYEVGDLRAILLASQADVCLPIGLIWFANFEYG